ncbi:DUF222 domain-containing protein [Nocardia huaxiensis]|uniref:DUF222 domain-containing protein n=1 Tax=Nocardia huaxiensis TaxID=2755382 RepID=A0A7D6ZSV2_9NOCA|nr:DUF222 domain-containing protein [Nocardia huaxiensis]QLY33085.1 DUF222 domain-containing protein [Nocardia huaxiensis]UFS93147.1 DUF222 domain-containing protein [Nocardia huaxiensis]
MFDSREVEDMGDGELIDALRRAHGAAAFAQAAEVTAVREVYRRHRAGNAAPGPGGVRAGEFAATEVAVAVRVSEGVATAMIDLGLALDSLPLTRKAFGAGRIDLSRVQVITDSMRGLPADVREALEPKLIEAAERSDPARLRQTARRWVARLDPEGEQRRREEREDDRDIRIRAMQDGMAVFDGLLPAAGAQTLAMRLREMSLQVCEDDPRSMPQRRADALVALADGSGRLRCGCGHGKYCPKSGAPANPRRPLIHIGVPAETLLGLRDDPGYLAGYGPIDAALARTIAEHARFQVIPEYFLPADAAPTSEGEAPQSGSGEDAPPGPASETRLTTPEPAAPHKDRPRTTRATHSPEPEPTAESTTRPAQDSADTASPDQPGDASALHRPQFGRVQRDRAGEASQHPGKRRNGGRAEEPAQPDSSTGRPARNRVGEPSAAERAGAVTAREEASPDQRRRSAAPAPWERAGELEKPAVVRPFSASPPREIRAVDGMCRFPNCGMPAAETVLAQFGPLPPSLTSGPGAASRAVLCTHHHRLKMLADKGKQPWRVYLADSDRMRWIDPSGESHETVREGARYLFPHTDIDAPTPTPLRAVADPVEPPAQPLPFTADLSYPVDDHILIHPQLSRCTPENDIPDTPARAVNG